MKIINEYTDTNNMSLKICPIVIRKTYIRRSCIFIDFIRRRTPYR